MCFNFSASAIKDKMSSESELGKAEINPVDKKRKARKINLMVSTLGIKWEKMN